MRLYKAQHEDPNMAIWEITESDIPVYVFVTPVYPSGVRGISGEIAKSYLSTWIKERNKQCQHVVDCR